MRCCLRNEAKQEVFERTGVNHVERAGVMQTFTFVAASK